MDSVQYLTHVGIFRIKIYLNQVHFSLKQQIPRCHGNIRPETKLKLNVLSTVKTKRESYI